MTDNVPKLEVRVSVRAVCGDLWDMVEGNDGIKARGFFSFLPSLVSHRTSSNLHFYLLHWYQKISCMGAVP